MPTRLVYLPARHQLDYLAEHVRRIVSKGRNALLVTANQSARRLWDYFAAVGIDVQRIYIVDVVSSPLLANARADSSHFQYLGNPMALETIIARSERLARQMPKPVHVVIHNLNAFCLYNTSDVLEEALRRVAREVADPDLLIDLVTEEEGGLYRDLDRFLTHFVDFKTVLGPRALPAGDRQSQPPEKAK